MNTPDGSTSVPFDGCGVNVLAPTFKESYGQLLPQAAAPMGLYPRLVVLYEIAQMNLLGSTVPAGKLNVTGAAKPLKHVVPLNQRPPVQFTASADGRYGIVAVIVVVARTPPGV